MRPNKGLLNNAPGSDGLLKIRKVKGTIACQETRGHAQTNGMVPWGTRVIWRKLDCLNPNLQKMQWSIHRKDA